MGSVDHIHKSMLGHNKLLRTIIKNVLNSNIFSILYRNNGILIVDLNITATKETGLINI